MSKSEKEINRIKQVYARRKSEISPQLYSFFNNANLFIIQGREREILKAFKQHNIASLKDKKILDIGCGTGGELRNFIRYGAVPENLYGVDLLSDRVDEAKKISPNINFKCGDASGIPYEDESFDIVMQFTVFTSILNKQMKQNIAKEMLRTLKPQGLILWYDYYMDNPKNKDVKGVKRKEIYELFPGCKIYLKHVTLAPPLTRVMAPYSVILCYLLEKMSFLCTHYLGIIKKELL